MNRINQLFSQKQHNILSLYFTAGYPDIDDTVPILEAMAAQGVDMAEIGIPFSDPMADGTTIQNSSQIALKNGMTLSKLFEQLKDIRQKIDIPLVMMGYLNPIMQYGVENFCRDCASTGIDGVIIPDLPFAEYLRDYKPLADRYGLKFIMLITPETSEERIRLIDEHTDGFIYMVSTAATTGTQHSFSDATLSYFHRIDRMGLRNPRLIGFGISNAATCTAAQSAANGVIVGSGFIKALAASSDNLPQAVANLLKQLRN
ncbi:tryptophan synthase subunit alpha [Millionella massiliensis]|uniref:tryptophan synthase subunit alpha n=1 Tax=Millionella massiliensis TaxID=1871023 RepID=UPI0008D92A76|nr:tryptophan synthase subunit alpha [Millionella massiliensis]